MASVTDHCTRWTVLVVVLSVPHRCFSLGTQELLGASIKTGLTQAVKIPFPAGW